MKKIVILLFIAAALLGCRTPKTITITEKETIVEYKEILRDTNIYSPADSAAIFALLECDSIGNVRIKEIEKLQGRINAKLDIDIKDNFLKVDCKCDSNAIYMVFKERFEKTLHNNKEQVIEEPSRWEKFKESFIDSFIAGIIFTFGMFVGSIIGIWKK